jgi:DNA-binding NtrC family response regulator
VGRGSTFTVILPRVSADPSDTLDRATESGDMPCGSETILVVEDDDGVRLLACATLERCGYRVLQASNPKDAAGLAGRFAGPIHLLVSDVIMPQSSDGPPLFDQLAKKRRGLRVLYISGYDTEAIGRHGVSVEGAPFLTKPFTALELSRKVYDLLETPPGG